MFSMDLNNVTNFIVTLLLIFRNSEIAHLISPSLQGLPKDGKNDALELLLHLDVGRAIWSDEVGL